MRCWECKLPLTHPKHLTGVYACKRCRYTTSCEKIYPVHQRVFHSKGVAPVFSMSGAILLERPLFCVCGYSADSGNRLARHMSNCECRTAYPASQVEPDGACPVGSDEAGISADGSLWLGTKEEPVGDEMQT
ncbi:uncharacterized protein LOC119112230 [Pollicipes pollicipes]|uniref:uncharacterized protein LOC119112230 n=1 Tax=Pollicipes pollicipes TaxID=41117 RepID=UPI001885915E|nr:uncharacterized protein LOC119112230 [Pollicipes pollicipes]